MFLDQSFFKLSCKNTHTNTHIHTHTHTNSDEYSIVAFCKNATIINMELEKCSFINWSLSEVKVISGFEILTYFATTQNN